MSGWRSGGLTFASACAAALVAGSVGAQSAQPWSLQGSVLFASQKIGEEAVSGTGFEGQFRYTPPKLYSLGIGFQFSSHPSCGDEITITGVFLEPRYAFDIGSDRYAPYGALRLAILNQSLTLDEQGDTKFKSSGSAFGAGAGLLIRLTRTVNIDIGAAFVSQSFGDAEEGGITVSFERFVGYVAKAGFSLGFGSR